MKPRHWQFFEVKAIDRGIGLLLMIPVRILLSGMRRQIEETKVSSLSNVSSVNLMLSMNITDFI